VLLLAILWAASQLSCRPSSPPASRAIFDTWWVAIAPGSEESAFGKFAQPGTAWRFGADETTLVGVDGGADRWRTTRAQVGERMWQLAMMHELALLTAEADGTALLHDASLSTLALRPAPRDVAERLDLRFVDIEALDEACRREALCCEATLPAMGGSCDYDPRGLHTGSLAQCAEGIRSLRVLVENSGVPVPAACDAAGLPDVVVGWAAPSLEPRAGTGGSAQVPPEELVRFAWAGNQIDAAILAILQREQQVAVLSWPGLKKGLFLGDFVVADILSAPSGSDGWVRSGQRLATMDSLRDVFGQDVTSTAVRSCGMAPEAIGEQLQTASAEYRSAVERGDGPGAMKAFEGASRALGLPLLLDGGAVIRMFLSRTFETWQLRVLDASTLEASFDGRTVPLPLADCGEGKVIDRIEVPEL
jgi:hypothetical protein